VPDWSNLAQNQQLKVEPTWLDGTVFAHLLLSRLSRLCRLQAQALPRLPQSLLPNQLHRKSRR